MTASSCQGQNSDLLDLILHLTGHMHTQLHMRTDPHAQPSPTYLVHPCAPLQATKRVCDSHLAQQLASPCRPGAAPEDGLLTMDAARSLVPLSAGDAQVRARTKLYCDQRDEQTLGT